jgi:hypothetical protein
MAKCGTAESCYACPFRPDDIDKYYDDQVSVKLGRLAEEISPNFSLDTVRQLAATAVGWHSVSERTGGKVLQAAQIRLTPECNIAK